MCSHSLTGLMTATIPADIKDRAKGRQYVNHELRSAVAGFATPPIYEEPADLWELDQGALAAVSSRVFDLAEGREPGHANRVAFLGRRIAEQLGLSPAEVDDVYFACLLHDVEKTIGRSEEERAAVPEPRSRIPSVEEITAGFGLRPEVAAAITEHKQFGWLGSRDEEPSTDASITARVVAAAERLDSIAAGGRSALLVRRRGPEIARSMASDGFGDEIADALGALTNEDHFWIGYYDNDLISSLIDEHVGKKLDAEQILEVFSALADLVDARNGHRPARARRVASLARDLAAKLGETEGRARVIALAALLQDIGTLGVPVSYVRKPDLLTIDELTDVQNHPILARDILSELPGLGAVAWWVACHHERVDGRGYPIGFAGEEVPIEAQILGLCETFEALVSDRPHRPAMSVADAMEVLQGLAGSRFVPELIRAFGSVAPGAALAG